MDDQSWIPRILADQPLPDSSDSKGKRKATDERDVQKRARGKDDDLEIFMQETLDSKDVPVIIRFSYGYWRDSIPDTKRIKTLVSQIERLRDIFTVVNRSETAQVLDERYGLKFPEHVREVIVELSDATCMNQTTYDHITTQMNIKIWEEEYIERGLQPSRPLYEAGKGPQIEINVEPHLVNHPHEPPLGLVDLSDLLRPRSYST